MRSITIAEFAKEINLNIISTEANINKCLSVFRVIRPGLELAGFFDFYYNDRILLFGSREIAFLNTLSEERRLFVLDKIISMKPQLIIFSKKVQVPVYFLRLCDKYSVAVGKGDMRTDSLLSKVSSYLQDILAPRILVHGALVDIFGMGTLITGESGIGKSEAVLELIKAGHQLIADDRVDIFQKDVGTLVGEAPDVTKRYIEVRGIGIVDVLQMYGVGSFRETKKVRLVAHLEKWDNKRTFDRIGIESNKVKYFDTEIDKINIPVSPGRNTATLIIAAALNAKLKYLGINTALEFTKKIEDLIEEKRCEI